MRLRAYKVYSWFRAVSGLGLIKCIIIAETFQTSARLSCASSGVKDPKTQERLMPRLGDLVTKLLVLDPAAS